MRRLRKGIIVALGLLSLGLLTAGDCDLDVDIDGVRFPRPRYVDVVFYEDVYYDPFGPCCY